MLRLRLAEASCLDWEPASFWHVIAHSHLLPIFHHKSIAILSQFKYYPQQQMSRKAVNYILPDKVDCGSI